MTLSTFLLLHVFTALLPPADGEDYEYYAVLGLSKYASPEDIRKAYRQLSLRLHPDKVAQRSAHDGQQQDPDEAAAEYERVQEAYRVLGDVKHRQRYHALQCSVARYLFIEKGNLYNPVALYGNLVHASFADKTRLVLVVSILLCLLLLQPILIAAKVNAVVEMTGSLEDTDWVLILIPTWILYGLVVCFWALLVLLAPTNRTILVASLCEHVSFWVGMFLMAQRWDGTRNTNWHLLSIPFYLGIFFKVISSYAMVAALRAQQAKMVSPEHFERTEGRIEEMDDEQQAALAEKYTVVTVDTDMVAHALEVMEPDVDLEEADLEALRVESSPEFQEVDHAARSLLTGANNLVIFGVTFIALVAAKLEGQINVNWWTIFTPIWVYLGARLLYSFSVCCCTALPGESITVVAAEGGGANDGDGDKDCDTAEATAGDENKGADPKPVATSDTNFASAEGDIKEFNQSLPRTDETPAPSNDEGNVTAIPDDEETGFGGETKEGGTTDTAQETADAPPTEEHGVHDEPKIDEETYRRWQGAFEKADESAMQAQAKAQSTCCTVCFQLLIICLIVGKLQADYMNDDPDNTGYNAFVILIPVFFVMGIVLCCCSCLIYCAPAGGLDEHGHGHDKHNHPHDEAVTQPENVPSTAQESNEPSTAPETAEPAKETVAKPEPDVEAGGEDINDLD